MIPINHMFFRQHKNGGAFQLLRMLVETIRRLKDKHYRKKLRNRDFSLICNNCTGGVLLHILGMQFNSPFVNLWIEPDDYMIMLKNFKEYMDEKLTFIETELDYPVALLKDVKIYFQHYSDKDEAERKWNERVSRINYDNLFILFICRDGYTKKNLEEFDDLPFQNKIAFSNKTYKNIKSHHYIAGFDDVPEILFTWDYVGEYSTKRYFDSFDFVNWFNGGIRSV